MKSLALHPSSRLVDSIEIAAPCHASWDDMVGDERTRFCGQCTKNVYNVAFMSADEVAGLVTATEGRACLRLYRRKDGTVITSDCPVGLAERAYKRARRMALASVALIVTMSAGLFAAIFKPSCAPGDEPLMGAVVEMPPEPPVEHVELVMGEAVAERPERKPLMGKPAPVTGSIRR